MFLTSGVSACFFPLISFVNFSYDEAVYSVFSLHEEAIGNRITTSAYNGTKNHLHIFAYFIQISDVLENVSKRIISIVLAPHPFL